MAAIKHNWKTTFLKSYCANDGRYALSRPDADCLECDAKIPFSEIEDGHLVSSGGGPWDQGDEDELNELRDRLWHEKLRPMAALCCLVEEANG